MIGFQEMICMIRKETCTACKGNRYVTVKSTGGQHVHKKCPHCGGNGFKVHLAR